MVTHEKELQRRRDKEQNHIDDRNCKSSTVQATNVMICSCAWRIFIRRCFPKWSVDDPRALVSTVSRENDDGDEADKEDQVEADGSPCETAFGSKE